MNRMQDDDEEGGPREYDLWSEDDKTRRHREWTEDYSRDADLGHDAELEREVQEFESGVAAGFYDDDQQREIVRKLIRRGVSPDRIGIRNEDKDRAAQTDGDQQSATDKEIRTSTIIESSPEFEFDVSDRKQLSQLETRRQLSQYEIERQSPVEFLERGLVSIAAGGYDLACELLRGYFLILQNPMTPETEHIVTTQILAIVSSIENRLRIALETLVSQLPKANSFHAKAVGICKVCRAEPLNPFVQVITNVYGLKKDKKEIGPRAEPNKQTIMRALKRLGQTRNRPVGGKSARQKASNLVARVRQIAPLLWIGRDAIMKTESKAASQGRAIFPVIFVPDPWATGFGAVRTEEKFSKTGRQKN